MKKQVWLRPDQVDLVISVLNYFDQKLNGELCFGNEAHKVAGRYTRRRIAEVLALFTGVKKNPASSAKTLPENGSGENPSPAAD